ncbi:DNA replication protein DnaC [Cerasibacillus quisquiliarum]|uniref:ATPase AAA n=1 Tax=Cerasibacillus quisquiliarum TaxID=227865 RepID=A0A511V5Q2_9BACI|nr:IS21-like element helper ATPase IstB [Cerasibacillus quisquiliarum]MBB5147607.1 DNA replication protein DnaC [Cerasibacillus quisquiliarum]GEN32532.1 ATPase AAA [Cerasibacillus quisquiliarum]
MSYSVESLQRQFKLFRMSETAKELPDFLRKAESHSWTYQEFLHELLSYEESCREQKMIEKHLKWARFPYQKSLNEFDLQEQRSLSSRQLKQLKELSWLEQSFNLIFLGPPGVGKTHLAIGLGLEAIQNGQRVSFISMGELIPLLKTEEYLRKAQIQLNRIRKADLVIIDDLMYMAMDQHEANLFFHLINHLYERSSIILTSNKGPEDWGELLGDQGITTAILDRLLHRSEVIHLNGESHRIKYRKSIF